MISHEQHWGVGATLGWSVVNILGHIPLATRANSSGETDASASSGVSQLELRSSAMLTVQTLVVAFSLSADAFAASLAKGARFPALAFNRSLLIACGFGALEALAPMIGYLLGRQFASVIADIDHWIAFVLLGFLGARMILKSFSPPDEKDAGAAPSWSAVVAVALGTSVDATVVGVTLALVSDNIPLTILTIGIVTFAMTFIGLRVGGIVGRRAGQWAELAGGVGLAAIGLNILVTHLAAL